MSTSQAELPESDENGTAKGRAGYVFPDGHIHAARQGAGDDDPRAEDVASQYELAKAVRDHLGDRLCWVQDWGTWMVCGLGGSGAWTRENREGSTRLIMEEVVIPAKPKAAHSTVRAVRDMAKPLLARVPSDFDRHPYLLGVQNGVLDLETLELRPRDPSLLLTGEAPVAWDPEAACPLTEAHVASLVGGKAKVARFLQKHMGAALIGDSSLKPQVGVSLVGAPGSGKGLLMRAVTAALGEGQYAVTMSSQDLGGGSDRHRQWITRTRGARILVFEEAKGDGRMNAALFKTLTGGDTLVGNSMRQNDTSWRPTHTTFLTSNYPLAFGADQGGVARRYRPVPTVAPAAAVPGYERALLSERAGMLKWLVEGCATYLKEDGPGSDIPVPKTVRSLIEDDLEAQDPFAEFFDKLLVFDPSERCHRSDVQAAYRVWAAQVGDRAPDSKSSWWSMLYTHLGQDPRVHAGRLRIGGKQAPGFEGVGVSRS